MYSYKIMELGTIEYIFCFTINVSKNSFSLKISPSKKQ